MLPKRLNINDFFRQNYSSTSIWRFEQYNPRSNFSLTNKRLLQNERLSVIDSFLMTEFRQGFVLPMALLLIWKLTHQLHDIIAFAFYFIISAHTIICGRQQIQLVTTESSKLFYSVNCAYRFRACLIFNFEGRTKYLKLTRCCKFCWLNVTGHRSIGRVKELTSRNSFNRLIKITMTCFHFLMSNGGFALSVSVLGRLTLRRS